MSSVSFGREMRDALLSGVAMAKKRSHSGELDHGQEP